MAIPNIQLGRVESDPMGVPVATSMRRTEDGGFERLLRESSSSEQPDVATEVPDSVEEAPVEEQQDPTSQQADAEPGEERDPRGDESAPADETDAAPIEDEADVTKSVSQSRQEQKDASAGKGSDTSRTSPRADEPLMTAAFHAQQSRQHQLIGGGQAAQQIGPVTARAVDPAVRGSANAQLASTTPPKAQSVQTGYATKTAQSMQMLEQARDSVFKQIMLKLSNDGGEMRMRLQPPELGQLDLRMTVEGGNKLQLLIAAERGDMAQLIQRHIEELKTTLQENGLEVTGAEVQTRDEFERQQAAEDTRSESGATAHEDIAEDAASAPQQRGYITAEGLDFWA